MLTWMDLLIIAAAAGVAAGVGIGVVLGQWLAPKPERTAPDADECGSSCWLAALPRDRQLVVRDRPSRRRTPPSPPPARGTD